MGRLAEANQRIYEVGRDIASLQEILRSPNSLYAYLQTILLGLNGLRLAENITTVLGRLSELQAAFDRVEEDVQLVGKHLRNSLNRFQEAESHLRAFRLQLSALSQAQLGDEQQRNTGMD